MTRSEARTLHLTQYQGSPCYRGHSGIRRVCSGACVECRHRGPSQRVTPRMAALAAGDKRYSGNPCKYSHDGERYTGSGKCVQCDRERKTAGRPTTVERVAILKRIRAVRLPSPRRRGSIAGPALLPWVRMLVWLDQALYG